MSKKHTYDLVITINVKVKSNMNVRDTIDEFSSETDYIIPSTDNVEVIHTEIIEVG